LFQLSVHRVILAEVVVYACSRRQQVLRAAAVGFQARLLQHFGACQDVDKIEGQFLFALADVRVDADHIGVEQREQAQTALPT